MRHQIIITNTKYYFSVHKHILSAIVHDILIAFLSFNIHSGYYKNMAVCIYTSNRCCMKAERHHC